MYDICRIFAPINICAMMKELDTFSYVFMVELLDCPKKNAFPSRKGKPAMCRFGGGYYSFNSQGQLEDCHYYVQDYQERDISINRLSNTMGRVIHTHK